jgi:hypothetical protein
MTRAEKFKKAMEKTGRKYAELFGRLAKRPANRTSSPSTDAVARASQPFLNLRNLRNLCSM